MDQHLLRIKLREQQLMWRIVNDQEIEIFDHDVERISHWLAELFFYYDLRSTLKDRLINHYYYYDFNEIDTILAIAAQILLTEQYKGVSFLTDLYVTYQSYFKLEDKKDLYDYELTIQQFYHQADWVIDEVVARAIDEKKQDESYQIFLQSLRDFVKERALGAICYLKQDADQLRIYQDGGKRYQNHELDQLIMSTPLHIYDFSYDDECLCPLLALNPKNLYIYSDAQTDPILTTLQNVFEERVIICPEHAFPY